MTPKRVLVVDDERAIREIIRERLETAGYDVRTAEDGQAALQAFGESGFDVVITDLHMPGIGGLELLRRVKDAAPTAVVIVLTGYGALDSAAEALRNGCDDYLLKPLPDLEMVVYAVQRSLERREALARAVLLSRLSGAKDDLLRAIHDECSNRLGELEDCLGRLEGAAGEIKSETVAALALDLKGVIGRMEAFGAEVEKVVDAVGRRGAAGEIR